MSIVKTDGQVYTDYHGFAEFMDITFSSARTDIHEAHISNPSKKERSPSVQCPMHGLDVDPALSDISRICLPSQANNASCDVSIAAEAVTDLASPASPTLFQCRRCNRQFTIRRSFLRHIKSVHEAKTFSCIECKIKFARKDTRDRHLTEKHSGVKMSVKCVHCGRCVAKRALTEHLDSDVCHKTRATQMAEAQKALIGLPMKYVGAEDDPFLAALRMLRLFAAKRPSQQNKRFRTRYYAPYPELEVFKVYSGISPRVRVRAVWLLPRTDYAESTLLGFENLVVALLAQRIAESNAPSISLAMAALLLGCMASAVDPQSLKSRIHFVGAAKLFKMQHNNACGCGKHYSCPYRHLSFVRHECAELVLLSKLLEEHEIRSGIIDIGAPEEAFDHPDKLLREGTFNILHRVRKSIRMRKRRRGSEVPQRRALQRERRHGKEDGRNRNLLS